MTAIRFPEFLASLENTKYPFIATATLNNGKVSLLEGTFLDAHVYNTTSFFRYYISEVVVESGKFTIYIGDETTPKSIYGEVSFPITTANVPLQDDYGRPAGILVSSPTRLSMLSGWGIGIHEFERDQTEFCATCQMPIPTPGVTGFLLDTGEVLSGKVWFVGDDGPEWIVVRAFRHGLIKASKPNNWEEIVSSLKNTGASGNYAEVTCASPDDVFDPTGDNAAKLFRGQGLHVRYVGLEKN